MQRIKASEVKAYRKQYLEQQHYLCALCKEPIDPAEAVLDHDHVSGQLRSVLHRGCNAYLGVIENNRSRNRISDARFQSILANAESYINNTKPILHSTYRTAEEKAERAKKRAKKKRAEQKQKRQ